MIPERVDFKSGMVVRLVATTVDDPWLHAEWTLNTKDTSGEWRAFLTAMPNRPEYPAGRREYVWKVGMSYSGLDEGWMRCNCDLVSDSLFRRPRPEVSP